MSENPTPPVELMVCVKCRSAVELVESEVRPGAQLLEAISGEQVPEHVTVTGVECLSNCTRGCSVALRGGAGRWTYVYGNFTPQDAALVLDGAQKYQQTEDGLVPWRERSDHFRKNCIARIPPMETSNV